uniref:Uncharacterized protein n=1 Tax=Onchocerca volvulus TaxID=6282 RepID=A0A8R1XNY0_ONCVO
MFMALCIPVSTYCTSYHTKDDKSSTLYIAPAHGGNSRNEASKSTARWDKQRPLLRTYAGKEAVEQIVAPNSSNYSHELPSTNENTNEKT